MAQPHASICVPPPLPCPQPDNMDQAPTSFKSQVITLRKSIYGQDAMQVGNVLEFDVDQSEDRFQWTFQNAEPALGCWAQRAGGV